MKKRKTNKTIEPKPKTLVFIDESNLSFTARNSLVNIDYDKFREYLATRATIIEAVVYIGMPPKSDTFRGALLGKENFATLLEKKGFFVVKKYGKPTGDSYRGQYKSNVDVMMAIDATEWAITIRPEAVILVTGDGDFAHLATKLRRMGIKVIVAGFVGSNLAEDLKQAANETIDLTKAVRKFSMTPSQNSEQPEDIAIDSETVATPALPPKK